MHFVWIRVGNTNSYIDFFVASGRTIHAVSAMLFLVKIYSNYLTAPSFNILLMYNMSVQLIPLHICLGAGVVLATAYTLRLALKNPDVQWNKKKDPNEAYREKQYKVRSSS